MTTNTAANATNPPCCPRCNAEFTQEEITAPNALQEGESGPLCDDCHEELYTKMCDRCDMTVDKTSLAARPGELIGVWEEAPADRGQTLQPGYYRVKQWPMYSSGMVEGRFFSDALVRVADLDDEGKKVANKWGVCLAGPMCDTCRSQAEKLAAEQVSAVLA